MQCLYTDVWVEKFSICWMRSSYDAEKRIKIRLLSYRENATAGRQSALSRAGTTWRWSYCLLCCCHLQFTRTIIRLQARFHQTNSVNEHPRNGIQRVASTNQDQFIHLMHLRQRFQPATLTARMTPGEFLLSHCHDMGRTPLVIFSNVRTGRGNAVTAQWYMYTVLRFVVVSFILAHTGIVLH